jgi:hypothetical protein
MVAARRRDLGPSRIASIYLALLQAGRLRMWAGKSAPFANYAQSAAPEKTGRTPRTVVLVVFRQKARNELCNTRGWGIRG